jgi:hypothetical protein
MGEWTLDYSDVRTSRRTGRWAGVGTWVVLGVTVAAVARYFAARGGSINATVEWNWVGRVMPGLEYSDVFLWCSGMGVAMGVAGAIWAQSVFSRLMAMGGVLGNLVLGALLWAQSAS